MDAVAVLMFWIALGCGREVFDKGEGVDDVLGWKIELRGIPILSL